MDGLDKIMQTIGEGGWMAMGLLLGYLLHRLEKKVEKMENKLDTMHDEFITKEDHYRDISGWRGEIHRLEDKIERLIEKVLEARK